MPRRMPGSLPPLEVEILHAALSMQRSGDVFFHGFGLAQSMGETAGGRLIGHERSTRRSDASSRWAC